MAVSSLQSSGLGVDDIWNTGELLSDGSTSRQFPLPYTPSEFLDIIDQYKLLVICLDSRPENYNGNTNQATQVNFVVMPQLMRLEYNQVVANNNAVAETYRNALVLYQNRGDGSNLPKVSLDMYPPNHKSIQNIVRFNLSVNNLGSGVKLGSVHLLGIK